MTEDILIHLASMLLVTIALAFAMAFLEAQQLTQLGKMQTWCHPPQSSLEEFELCK